MPLLNSVTCTQTVNPHPRMASISKSPFKFHYFSSRKQLLKTTPPSLTDSWLSEAATRVHKVARAPRQLAGRLACAAPATQLISRPAPCILGLAPIKPRPRDWNQLINCRLSISLYTLLILPWVCCVWPARTSWVLLFKLRCVLDPSPRGELLRAFNMKHTLRAWHHTATAAAASNSRS